jgi:hypothetical protein
MNKEKFLGVLRHVLTFAGGIMVTKGIFDQALAAELTGSVMTLTGVIWSVVDKK